MEGHRHDAVREIEGLLDAVAVVDVDVEVQHARVVLEQLQDGQHQVVEVAEPAGLCPLGVVQPAGPVDGRVHQAVVQLHAAVNGGASVFAAEVEDALKDGAVLLQVEALQQVEVVIDVVRGDFAQEVDVVLRMELGDLHRVRSARPKDIQLVVQAVAEYQVVCHAHAVRLHGVVRPVVHLVVVVIVVVADALGGLHHPACQLHPRARSPGCQAATCSSSTRRTATGGR
mmetsp:Transcript_7849/g.19970  ORF Transcript_7849/g.19970 Transcript_7849/m.19970 type:complete len:228 (+) Transcript_7849:888-1571(+)